MEVYVDYLLVKSWESMNHIADLSKAFNVLWAYKMRLNPANCAFGVFSGKLLEFLISQIGIEANPKKIKTILEMQPPKNTKELQRLAGRVAALNRFNARATNKCLPFF